MSDVTALGDEQIQLLLEVADLQRVRESVEAKRHSPNAEPRFIGDCDRLLHRVEHSLGLLAERCTQLGLTREFALISTGWPYNLRPAERRGSAAQRVQGALATLGTLSSWQGPGHPSA